MLVAGPQPLVWKLVRGPWTQKRWTSQVWNYLDFIQHSCIVRPVDFHQQSLLNSCFALNLTSFGLSRLCKCWTEWIKFCDSKIKYQCFKSKFCFVRASVHHAVFNLHGLATMTSKLRAVTGEMVTKYNKYVEMKHANCAGAIQTYRKLGPVSIWADSVCYQRNIFQGRTASDREHHSMQAFLPPFISPGYI